MPIDAQWQKVTITGNYPKARFYSFALYDNAPVSTALADHLFDAQIVPDPAQRKSVLQHLILSATRQTALRITP